MKFLSAPWRWKFISGASGKGGCIFCQALKKKNEKGLVCFRGDQYFIMMNKYPYTSGHVMIAPQAHLDSPDRVKGEDAAEMWELMNRSMAVLKQKFILI